MVVLLHLAEEAAGWPAERLGPALHPAAQSPAEARRAGAWERALHPAGSVLVRPAGSLEPALHPAGSAPARLAVPAQREPADEGRRAECSDSC